MSPYARQPRRTCQACSPPVSGDGPWSDHAALAHLHLGDDAVRSWLRRRRQSEREPLHRPRPSLAYARPQGGSLGSANEHADWEPAIHVFTYANAVHRLLKRIKGTDRDGHFDAERGILHGVMALYLARYLNPPPAQIPGGGGDDGTSGLTICLPMPRRSASLCSMPSTGSGRSTSRHVSWHAISRSDHPPKALIATLARALLREDAGFHAYQMLEAGVRQFGEWGDTNEGRHILIAVARYLAAIHPLSGPRCRPPDIARRLMRGGELHQEATA